MVLNIERNLRHHVHELGIIMIRMIILNIIIVLSVMQKPRLYASIDIESDGNNPCQHSMISCGISFITSDGKIIEEIIYNLFPRKDRSYEPRCMTEFWMNPEQHEAWNYIQQDRVTPEKAMAALAMKLSYFSLSWDIEWIAYPACFDWMFLKTYYEEFGPIDKISLGYYCVDIGSEIRSVAITIGKTYDNVIAMFTVPNTSPHVALYDARCQGIMYVNFVTWRQSLRKHFQVMVV